MCLDQGVWSRLEHDSASHVGTFTGFSLFQGMLPVVIMDVLYDLDMAPPLSLSSNFPVATRGILTKNLPVAQKTFSP